MMRKLVLNSFLTLAAITAAAPPANAEMTASMQNILAEHAGKQIRLSAPDEDLGTVQLTIVGRDIFCVERAGKGAATIQQCFPFARIASTTFLEKGNNLRVSLTQN